MSDHGLVAIIKDKQNKYLLLKDTKEPMMGYWIPPHVCYDPEKEDAEDVIIKKMKNVYNLNLTPEREAFYTKVMGEIKDIHFWICKRKEITQLKLDNGRYSEFRWFKINEVLNIKNLYSGTRRYFTKFNKNHL